MKSTCTRKSREERGASAAPMAKRTPVLNTPELSFLQTTERARLLVDWLGLSLSDLYEYCNHSVSIPQFFRILQRRQSASPFERKALVLALCKALQGRPEALFEATGHPKEEQWC